jgi:hypothetical protein
LQSQFPDEMIDVILKRNGADAWGQKDIDDRPYDPKTGQITNGKEG